MYDCHILTLSVACSVDLNVCLMSYADNADTGDRWLLRVITHQALKINVTKDDAFYEVDGTVLHRSLCFV